MKKIRTIKMLGNDHRVHMLPADHVLDIETMPMDERKAMLRDGRAEFRTNLDAPRGEGDFLARVPDAERAS